MGIKQWVYYLTPDKPAPRLGEIVAGPRVHGGRNRWLVRFDYAPGARWCAEQNLFPRDLCGEENP